MKFNPTACNDCPYRKDAPIRKWHKKEFAVLLQEDASEMGGKIYACHKQNGLMCGGWLHNQDKRGLPSIFLRMFLSKNNITREMMDRLDNNKNMFASIKAMVRKNFPSLLKTKTTNENRENQKRSPQ